MNSALHLHLLDGLDTLMLLSSRSMLRTATSDTSTSTISARYELSTDHSDRLLGRYQVIWLIVIIALASARQISSPSAVIKGVPTKSR